MQKEKKVILEGTTEVLVVLRTLGIPGKVGAKSP